MPSPSARYDSVAQILHWAIGLGIIALIGLGLAMDHLKLPPARVFAFYQLHKSIGITVLLLVALRVGWRLTHRPPALPDAMPRAERRAAHLTHGLLYLLQIVLPLSGWALVSASAFAIPTVLYGVVRWPDMPGLATIPHKAAVEARLVGLHHWAGWILTGLVALHIAAALRHRLLLRDGVLDRMLPRISPRRRAPNS